MAEMVAPGFSSGSLVRQLLLVTPDLLPQVWPQIVPLLLSAKEIWEECYTLDSLLILLQQKQMQLWTMNDESEFILALLTEVLTFPKMKVLHIVFIGGRELAYGLEFFDCVEMWAHKQGAMKSYGIGREGFLRVLKPYGYVKSAVAFEKDISHMVEH